VIEPAGGAAEARRLATDVAVRLGFDEADAGRVALVATEAATNLAKHAGGGDVLVSALHAGGTVGVEVLALDKGPGIANIPRTLSDGYSTSGSPGTGLGAMRRMSREFEIYSTPGGGTAVLARVYPRGSKARQPATMEVAGVCVAMPGESACGDAWAMDQRPGCATILVADGLGHGYDAAVAAQETVRLFQERPGLAPTPMLERLHAGLRPTRGAAVAAIQLDFEHRLVHFAGIGNISGTILNHARRSLASYNGTLGHEVRQIRQFEYPWPEAGLLVLHTDGLVTHWSLDTYPGLSARHPGLIAGVLYRDFKRGRDDVTVVVAREPVG
jgi:anti-sigma regulatory factor (Ser/Thr protein kinase)